MNKKSTKIWTIALLLAVSSSLHLSAMQGQNALVSFLKIKRILEKQHAKGSWNSVAAEPLLVLYDQIENKAKQEMADRWFSQLFGIDIAEAKKRINKDKLEKEKLKKFGELCAQTLKMGSIKQLLASNNFSTVKKLLIDCRRVGSDAERIFCDIFKISPRETWKLIDQLSEDGGNDPDVPDNSGEKEPDEKPELHNGYDENESDDPPGQDITEEHEEEKDPLEELEVENSYIVFEYERETANEPDFVIVSGSQEIPDAKPHKDPYEVQNEIQTGEESSTWDWFNRITKIKNPTEWFKADQKPSMIPYGPKVPETDKPFNSIVERRSQSNNYHWHHISNRILDTCLPDDEKVGLRGMWVGCLDSVNPATVKLDIIDLIWILVHGTWGHRTPSFFDENNDNFKEIEACIEVQAQSRKNALLLSHRWTGENTVEAREKGAQRLKVCLASMRLLRGDVRLTLVAHSHGCNALSNFSQLLDEAKQENISTLIYFACPRRPEEQFQPEHYDNLVFFWGTNDVIASLGSISWDQVLSNVDRSRIFPIDQIYDGIAGGLQKLGCEVGGQGVRLLGKLQLGKAIYFVYQVVIQRAKSPLFPGPEKDDIDDNGKGESIRIGTNVNIRGENLLKPLTIHSDIVNVLSHLRVIFNSFKLNNDPQSGHWDIDMNSDGSQFNLS